MSKSTASLKSNERRSSESLFRGGLARQIDFIARKRSMFRLKEGVTCPSLLTPDWCPTSHISSVFLLQRKIEKNCHKDIFNVSDLSRLKVLKEEFLGDRYGSVVYQFGIEGKKQEIKCSFRGCAKIRLKSGSLIYQIGFDKYDLKTNMSLDNGGIVVDGDDLPTNAIPLVNFVLSLRNKAAEGQ